LKFSNRKYHYTYLSQFLNTCPFLKALFPFIVGIFLYPLAFIADEVVYVTFILCFILSIFISRKTTTYNLFISYRINGFTIAILLVAFGYFVSSKHDMHAAHDRIVQNSQNRKFLCLQIDDIVKKQPEHYTTIAILRDSSSHKHPGITSPKILCYFRTKSTLKRGDIIITTSKPEPFNTPKNPGSFDRKTYYENKGISYFLFAADNHFVHARLNTSSLLDEISTIRWRIRDRIVDYMEPEEAGVTVAMLLGTKQDLTEDIKTGYAETGVMHILAVSGLHIGILFLFIRFVFGPYRHHQLGKWLFVIIALSAIWGFALLAGMSNSVFRASIMFTIFILAEITYRKNYAFNSTAAAAFIILFISPSALYDVGFQLSFAAVFAILTFYRPIYRLLSPNNKIAQWSWQMISVSLAAQIGTLPITLYYFHQFPPGAMIANFIGIPMALLMLTNGFVLIMAMVLSIRWIESWLMKFIEYIAFIGNKLLLALHNILPGVTTVYIDTSQTILLYCIVAATATFLYFRTFASFLPLVVSICLFLVIGLYHKHQLYTQKQIVCYSLSSGLAMDRVSGSGYEEISGGNLQREAYRYEIAPTRTKSGISMLNKANTVNLDDHNILLSALNDQTIVILRDQKYTLPETLKVDYLVLDGGRLNDYWMNYYSHFADKIVASANTEIYLDVDAYNQLHLLKHNHLIIN